MSLAESHLTYGPIVDRLGQARVITGNKIHSDLRLFKDDRIEVYYAPLRSQYPASLMAPARILFVGLTPGLAQAKEAYESYFNPNPSGADTVSFSGTMRSNLVRVMNSLHLPEALGVESTAVLFSGTHRSQCISTSLLKFPVFKNDKNYSGNPSPQRHPFLMKMIADIFVPTILSINSNTLVVPFGEHANAVLNDMKALLGGGFETQCLFGFPHPSGANNGGIAKYMRSDLLKIHIEQVHKVLGRDVL